MIRRRWIELAPRDRWRVRLVLLVLWLAVLLDVVASSSSAAAPVPYVGAAVFSFIVTGIQLLAGWIATAAEITVTYLAAVVSWLVGVVGSFLVSVGAVFAKIWDGIKIIWSDVLKPALVWLDKTFVRIHDWMVKTFKPVFDWLKLVRCRLNEIYTNFVRPVLDTIDFVRDVNRVLLAFHIHLLESLDKVLADLERRIEEPILWLYQQLTRVQNLLDAVVSFDGLFQKYMLVASLRKHLPDWSKYFWHDQVGPTKGRSTPDRLKGYPARDVNADAASLGEYLERGGGERAPVIDELAITLMQVARGDAVPALEGADV